MLGGWGAFFGCPCLLERWMLTSQHVRGVRESSLLVVFFFFFFNDTAPSKIYPLSLPDALPISATAALRAMEAGTGRHLPIIAMTAHAMKGDEERCLQAGMDAYLAKPIHPSSLFALVEEVCGQRPAGAL